MALRPTEKSIRQFIEEVSDQQYAMAGAVIAISAAQTDLGEPAATRLDHQIDN